MSDVKGVCKHCYESRVIKVQERDKNNSSSLNIVLLEQEKHYIFCIKCGDIKYINFTYQSIK